MLVILDFMLTNSLIKYFFYGGRWTENNGEKHEFFTVLSIISML